MSITTMISRSVSPRRRARRSERAEAGPSAINSSSTSGRVCSSGTRMSSAVPSFLSGPVLVTDRLVVLARDLEGVVPGVLELGRRVDRLVGLELLDRRALVARVHRRATSRSPAGASCALVLRRLDLRLLELREHGDGDAAGDEPEDDDDDHDLDERDAALQRGARSRAHDFRACCAAFSSGSADRLRRSTSTSRSSFGLSASTREYRVALRSFVASFDPVEPARHAVRPVARDVEAARITRPGHASRSGRPQASTGSSRR